MVYFLPFWCKCHERANGRHNTCPSILLRFKTWRLLTKKCSFMLYKIVPKGNSKQNYSFLMHIMYFNSLSMNCSCTKYRRLPEFFLGQSVAQLGNRTGFFSCPDRFSVTMFDWASASLYPCGQEINSDLFKLQCFADSNRLNLLF